MKPQIIVQDKKRKFLTTEVYRTKKSKGKLTLWVREVEPAPKAKGDLSPLDLAYKKVIEDHLEMFLGVKRQVAIALDITINTLEARLKKYGIVVKRK
jgi:DNA-binding NtrC family response regulator